jgi:leader peptidase (prepilin peptidase) / N-methyltransferase
MMVYVELFIIGFAFLFGSLIGSFSNVLIYRIPRKESVAFPPSHCPNCNHQLGVLDLFPIFSWLFLRGKCRYCGNPITSRYPIIEFISGLGYALIAWKVFGNYTLGTQYGFDRNYILEALGMMFLYTCLLVGSAIDLETKQLPDEFTLLPLFVGLALSVWIGGVPGFYRALEGAIFGAGILAFVAGFFAWVLRRFKEPKFPSFPVGYLNIHLAFLVGAWLGPIYGVAAGVLLTILNLIFKRVIPMPDFLTLGGGIISIFVSSSVLQNHSLASSAYGALQAAGGMALLAGLYWWFTPEVEDDESEDGDPVAFGFGDVKLWGAVGVVLFWQGAIFGFFIGVFAGAIFGVIQKARTGDSQLPFGPGLALGALVAYFTNSSPFSTYLQSIGILQQISK